MSIGSKTADDLSDFLAVKNIRKEVDTTDGSVIYTAWAKRGSTTSEAVWRIKRTTISGSSIKDEWADSNLNFDNVFDDRGSLTYG